MSENYKKIKKQIIDDWRKPFPQLTVYSNDKLYKIVGAFIIGIELIKLPRTEEYRPHFVCYPLWKNGVKECLNVPIILREFYNSKGLQYSIPYIKHSIYIDNALEHIIRQMPVSFDGDVDLQDIFKVIDECSGKPPLRAAHNSYLQALLQEAKLNLALYSGSNELIQKILGQIQNRNWDVEHFKICGVDLSEWLQGLLGKIKEKNKLISQIVANKQKKKFLNLKRSEFIYSQSSL